jgi:hypothetical protein
VFWFSSSLLQVWLTGNASRDDNDVGAGEGLLHAIVGGEVALDLGDGGDVGEVGRDAGRVDDIVERELVDVRARLEQEGEGLANACAFSSADNGLERIRCCVMDGPTA